MRKFSTNINSTTDFYILCTTFRSKFFVSQYRKISLGNTSVYQKISGSEKFYASERGEGVSRFSVENFLSHSAENFRRGILYCCNNFGYRKSLDKGGVSRFSVEVFVSLYRNISLENTSVFQKNFMHRRGGITVLSELFVSQDRNEKLCRGTLVFSGNFLVSKKIYGSEGAYHDFQSKFLCLTVPKTYVRESYCF